MSFERWGELSSNDFETLATWLSDFVVLADDGGILTHVGTVAAAAIGDDADSLVGQPLTLAVHESDSTAVDSLLRATRRQQSAVSADAESVDVRVDDGDGNRRWLELTPVGRLAADGGVALFVRDCTDHHQRIQWFKHLIKTASDLLVVLDENGVFTYLSPASERLIGYQPAELRGKLALDHIHPDDRPTVETELARGLAEPGYTATVEHRFRSKDGEWRWLESRGRSLDESAVNGRIVVVTRDVTERRRREQHIAAQNDRLDTFAGIVSHDLQGPLTVASGSLELYRRTGDETSLDRAERALERMSQLTSSLLALAREGEVSDDFETVPLHACATAALGTTPLPDEAVTVAEDLPAVRGDESSLRSVFENLFRNVATHAGETARVWVEPLPDEPGFSVEDDGSGLPSDEDTRAGLFEAGRSGSESGTGFGLYIVETIATAHGWTVTATDGSRGGARFEFRDVDTVS